MFYAVVIFVSPALLGIISARTLACSASVDAQRAPIPAAARPVLLTTSSLLPTTIACTASTATPVPASPAIRAIHMLLALFVAMGIIYQVVAAKFAVIYALVAVLMYAKGAFQAITCRI